jgi:leucyl-tRNA synthetase
MLSGILFTLVVQFNGQVCDYLEMSAGTNKSETERLDLAVPKVQIFLEGKQIRKVIVVPERKVSIVCS